jgi:hypothetical protein
MRNDFAGALLRRPAKKNLWKNPMAKPHYPRELEEKAKKKPGGQQHQNPPRKTSYRQSRAKPA